MSSVSSPTKGEPRGDPTGSSTAGDAGAGGGQVAAQAPGSTGPPRWALVLLGASLVAILAIGAATLYRVSQLEVDAQRSRQELAVAKATQVLVNAVAERQRHENVPAKIEAASAETKAALAGLESQMTEMQSQMTEMQGQITQTQKLLVETQNTMNQLLTQADAASTKAKEASATLQSKIESLRQTQQQLKILLNAELKRLAIIAGKVS